MPHAFLERWVSFGVVIEYLNLHQYRIHINEHLLLRQLFEEYKKLHKVKGEKHSVSKVKTLAPVDIEKLNSINEFVEMTVTPQRLEQGIATMLEQDITIERKNTGDFLRWIVNDILKEELDQLTGNGLCAKDVGKAISTKARPFWFSKCDSNF